MRAGRPKRVRSRAAKSKRRLQRPDKRDKALPRAMANRGEVTQFEPTHSLLLSSLKFWEVERDLIDERVAALSR